VNGTRRLISTLVAGALFVGACGSSGTPANGASSDPVSSGPASVQCQSATIVIAGSTALQPLLQDAANAYMNHCTQAAIVVNGGGSGTGLSQVSQGAIDIGSSDVLASTKLGQADADALVDHVVCRQGWIVVTNPDVSGVTNLTTAQQVQIWTGGYTNWSQVGGPDLPIVLILRPQSSGTRQVFRDVVLGGKSESMTGGQTLTEDSNGAVTEAVAHTKGSISVIGFAYYNVPANKSQLNGLQLDGVDATLANMVNGSYKLAADGHLYTKGQANGLAADFLEFMKTDEVQKTIEPNDFYGAVSS
jgi:phosphate transport system substrate-binding protein